MTDETAVEAAGLVKSYGAVKVLHGVDLRVARGSVFALLGPNGAGKTTTVRILSTLAAAGRRPGARRRHDVVADRRAVRRRIGLTGSSRPSTRCRPGEENLSMMGRLGGLPRGEARRRAAELLERFDLADAGGRRVGDVLRRHAPPPRPRRQSRRAPGRALPRRADDRPRPAQPAGDVGR